jgi:extracellular solute-binding protein
MMAEMFGVSINTVKRAYQALHHEGVLERFPRRGVVLKRIGPTPSASDSDAGQDLTRAIEPTTPPRPSQEIVRFVSPECVGRYGTHWQRILNRFVAAAPDLRVRGTLPDSDWRVRQADAVMFTAQQLPDLVARGELRPLEGLADLIPRQDFEAIPSDLFQYGQIDGVTWALPLACQKRLLYYNVDLLEALGVETPGHATSLDVTDTAIAVSRAVREQGLEGICGINLPYPSILASSMGLRNEDWSSPSLLDRHGETLRLVWEYYARFAQHPDAAWRGLSQFTDDDTEIRKDFREGRLAMMLAGGHALAPLAASVPFRLGVVDLQTALQGRQDVVLFLLGMGSESGCPMAGGRWILHLLSEPGQKGLAAEKLNIPVNRRMVAEMSRDDRVAGLDCLGDSLEGGHIVTEPIDKRQPVLIFLARPLAARLFLGEVSVEEACAFFSAEHPRVLSAQWPSTG